MHESAPPTRVPGGTQVLKVLTLLVVLLAGCDRGPSVLEHLEAANRLVAANDLRAAVIEFKNALQKDPGHVEARWGLGQAYLRVGAGAAAEKELERAEALGKAGPEVALSRARAYLLQERFDEALEILDAREGAAGAAGPLALRGHVLLGLRRVDEGEASFRAALAADPGNAEALRGLARVAWHQGRVEEVEGHLDRALEGAPDDVLTWLLKGEFAVIRGETDQAVAAYTKALELAPYQPLARLGVASALLAQGETARAEEHIAILLREIPNHPMPLYLKAVTARQREDFSGAEEALRTVLSLAPGHAPSLLLSAGINYAQRELEQAAENLRNFLAVRGRDANARKILAMIYLQLGREKQAIEALMEMPRSAADDPQVLAMLGVAYMRQGEYDKATALHQRAADVAPEPAAYRTRLALTRLAAGDRGEAISDLKTALAVNPEYTRAGFVLMHAHLEAKEYDRVLEVARSLAEGEPENPIPLNFMGVAYENKGDVEAARRQYERALEVSPTYTTAALNLAHLDLDAGDEAAARRRYDKLLEQDRNHVPTLIALARLAKQKGENERALEILEQSRAATPTAFEPRVELAEDYLRLRRYGDALAAALEAHELAPNRQRVLIALASAQIATRRFETALETARRLVARFPEVPAAHFLLAQALAGTGDRPGSRAALEQALARAPDHARALLALANLEIADGRAEKAVAIARRLVEKFPEQADPYLTLSRAYIASRSFDDAREVARKLTGMRPGSALAWNVLGGAHEAAGDRAGARAAYERAAGIEEDKAAVVNLARLDLLEGKTESARRRYEKVLEVKPGHLQSTLGLAAAADREGRDAEAVDLLEQARKANPLEVTPHVVLARYYLDTGRFDEAEAVAADALVVDATNREAILISSRARLAKNDLIEALALSDRLLSSHPDWSESQFQAALVAYRRLSPEGRTRVPQEIRDRLEKALERDPRHLAALMLLGQIELASGDTDRALELARRMKEVEPDAPRAHSLEGDVLLARGNVLEARSAYRAAFALAPLVPTVLNLAKAEWVAGSRPAALTTLQQWLEARPEDASVREALGDLYSLDGQTDRAVREYEQVVALDPDRVSVLNNLAWFYHQRGDARAMDTARRAFELGPDQPNVLDTYGWILVQEGQIEQGRRLLEKAVGTAPERPGIRYHLAVALAKTGALDAARRELETLLEGDAEFPDREKAEKMLEQLR